MQSNIQTLAPNVIQAWLAVVPGTDSFRRSGNKCLVPTETPGYHIVTLPESLCLVGTYTYRWRQPYILNEKSWPCHRLPLFMGASANQIFQHSSRWCKRHSWRTKLVAFSLNHLLHEFSLLCTCKIVWVKKTQLI